MDTSSMPEMTVSGPASGGNRPESLSGGAYPDQEKGKSRKSWWRRLIKVLLIVAVSLAGLFVLLGGVVWLVLTPPRLTPLVNRVATKYLNAEVHFDTVRLSLFENFPHVSLELKNGEVISGVFAGIPDSLRGYVPQRADSLLRFKEFAVTLNLPRLLAAQIAVRQLKLVDPDIYAFVSPAGNANWNIYTSADTTADTTATDLSTIFGIRVRELLLEGGRIRYESRPDRVEAALDSLHLRLRGHRSQRYEIDFGGKASMQQEAVRYARSLPLSLSGGFAFDTKNPGGIALDQLAFKVDDIPAVFDGNVTVAADSIVSDMTCRVNPLRFKQAFGLIPVELMPAVQRVETDLTADLETKITGTYRFNGSVLPSVRLDCKVDGGYLGYRGSRARIDNLLLDASLFYHPSRSDSTGVILRKLSVDGIGMKFRAGGTAWDVLRDARVKGNMHGSINLGTLTELFPSKQKGIVAHGIVGIDADLACRLSELTPRRIGQTRVHAVVTLNDMLVDMPQDTLRLVANGTRISLGANPNLPEQDTLIAAGTQVVYLEVQADTMHVNLKDQMAVAVSGAELKMRNAASVFSGDTTVVHPFTGSVRTRYVEVNGLDSTWVKAGNASIAFSILPSASDPQVPMIRTRIESRGLAARSLENIYVLRGADVNLEAILFNTRRRMAQQRDRMLDSLQRVYPAVPRDSLMAHNRALRRQARGASRRVQDDFAGGDIDMRVDRSIGELLRRWNAKGSITAAGGRVITPYFPLTNTLGNVDVSFTTDRIDLRGTTIHSGVSELNLTGKVSNLRRALLGRGKLVVDMNIESDTLDVNELVKAANAGAAYASSSEGYKDSLRQATSQEHLQQMIEQKTEADTASQSPLIVIPANVEMDVDLDVRYGVYADLILNRLSGCLVVRDRCLQLNDLTAVTDAGELTLTALYATRSRTDITTGFDLEMKKIQVDRLIKLLPSVDTMLPMLRSFEGVVDCQLAAAAALDSSMNFLMPTVNAACRIHGENMVLLDGETFTEISKMLHFKNKKRNMIDKISVEMIVRDNQIEIFPFVIEMDRYRAAVSGVQKLDMSFDYHISVLKSPIPFRLGIDIYGNPDKFKFRICRARYKSVDVPTYVELIDSTRLNLRRRITDIFHRGVEAATLSELSVASAVHVPSEATLKSEELTAADTLLLRQQGILPDTTVQKADSLLMPAAGEPLDGGSRETVVPDRKGKSSRRKQRKQSSEAVLPEERTATR